MSATAHAPTELAFRFAQNADVDAIVALVESAYRGESSKRGWTTEADLLDGQRTDPESLRALLAKPGSEIVLAEHDGVLLASANLEHQGERAYFGMFAVRPELQGAGLGKRVLGECERRARDAWHCRVMRMTVISVRPELIAWYERRGYRHTGERAPFPYGDARFGQPKRDDLEFIVLEKPL